MASFTAGTTFVDGVSNDVTAAKLGALVTNATPTSGFIQDRTAETVTATNDTLLIGDASDSNNLKRITVANFAQTLPTAKVTTGTIETGTFGTTTSTAATITTGVIPTLTTGTTTSTNEVVTNGTITNLSATTSTFLGTITGSTNVVNIGSGQIYKDASGNVGIGTTSPTNKLTIFGESFLNYDGSSGLLFRKLSSENRIDSYDYPITSGYPLAILGSAIRFQTGTTSPSEAMRIDSSGRVGIGTTSPVQKLQVRDGTNRNFSVVSDVNYSNAGGIAIISTNDANTAYAPLSVACSPLILNAAGGSGNVGIGTASPSAQLELSTDSAKKPSTNTWTIASDQRLKTNITNADNDRCYEIVKQVPLKRYTWKSEVYSQEKVKDRSKLGWIAQDVEAVFPKAVGTNRFAYNQVFEDVVTQELDSDGNTVLDENGVAKTKTEKRLVSEDVIEDCKDLNSDQIYAAMYGTIQKLIEKVESLESKVAALEAA